MKTNKPFNIRIGTKKSDDLDFDIDDSNFFNTEEKIKIKNPKDRLNELRQKNNPNKTNELF